MSNQQLFINQRYHEQRLAATSSINAQGQSGSEGNFDVDVGALACFFNAIGARKLPEDLTTMIEIFFASSFAKIFSFGLNTFPNSDWKTVFGAMQELGVLNIANPEHLGVGNYVHLKSGLINSQRRH